MQQRPGDGFRPALAGQNLEHGVQGLPEVPEILGAILLLATGDEVHFHPVDVGELPPHSKVLEEVHGDDGVD